MHQNHKHSPMLSSIPVWVHKVWGRHLPLLLQESKPIKDDSRQEYSSQMSQKKDFCQSKFCTIRTLLFSPCCSYHVNTIESLGNQKLPLTEILHLTETRVFLKLVIACVLLQWMTVAKKAHHLGIQGGAEQSWATRSWLVLWTGWKEWRRRQLSNWDVSFLFPDKLYFSRALKNCWVIQLKIQVSAECRKRMTNLMRHCRSLRETELGQNPMLVGCN